jgi:hypothetical protein
LALQHERSSRQHRCGLHSSRAPWCPRPPGHTTNLICIWHPWRWPDARREELGPGITDGPGPPDPPDLAANLSRPRCRPSRTRTAVISNPNLSVSAVTAAGFWPRRRHVGYLQRCPRRSPPRSPLSLPLFVFLSRAGRPRSDMSTPQNRRPAALSADGLQITADLAANLSRPTCRPSRTRTWRSVRQTRRVDRDRWSASRHGLPDLCRGRRESDF